MDLLHGLIVLAVVTAISLTALRIATILDERELKQRAKDDQYPLGI
jgi:hypothetical protein